MSSFAKLFSNIVTSTIWQEDNATRLVWVTMLALADRNGEVDATVPGLANLARVTIPECETALQKFLSPDKYSRSQKREGRRIEVVEGGWRLLNYEKYRAIGRGEDRREYLKTKKREQRTRERQQKSTPVNKSQHCQPIAEAEAEAKGNNDIAHNPPQGTCVANAPAEQPPEANPQVRGRKRRARATASAASNNSESFSRFWDQYPHKVGKQICLKIWKRLKPSAELAEQIIAAVQRYKRTEQWQEKSGRFIPYPATWLNEGRWEDEIPVKPEPQRGDPNWLPTAEWVDENLKDELEQARKKSAK